MGADPFGALDDSAVNRFQWKIMLVSGMGFFTDAYDLFVIGIVVASQSADLLVLGTRGRSPFAGLMLGSVSQGCSAHANCPVVLVKKSDDPAPAD